MGQTMGAAAGDVDDPRFSRVCLSAQVNVRYSLTTLINFLSSSLGPHSGIRMCRILLRIPVDCPRSRQHCYIPNRCWRWSWNTGRYTYVYWLYGCMLRCTSERADRQAARWVWSKRGRFGPGCACDARSVERYPQK